MPVVEYGCICYGAIMIFFLNSQTGCFDKLSTSLIKRGWRMSSKKNETVAKADYSLLLINLKTALYKSEGNPYTGSGSVFFIRKGQRDLKNIIYDAWNSQEAAFFPPNKYVEVLSLFHTSPIPEPNMEQTSQEMFWITHLAGWKRKGGRPDRGAISNLFNDKDNSSDDLRGDLCVALENSEWKEKDGKAKTASEYIVKCNYKIIKKYCGSRRHLLKQIISDFANNMEKAEETRNNKKQKSLIKKNENELIELRKYLTCMMEAYEQILDQASDEKDWLLSRCLSWLLIAAMLRNHLTIDLIENFLKPNLLKTGLIEEPEKRKKEKLDNEYLVDNFQENEDVVYGIGEKIQKIKELFDNQRGGFGRSRIVYIQGIGGIGKSTLAKAYAERYLKNYDVVVEVSASSVKDAVMLMPTSIPEDIQYQARLQRIASICGNKNILLIVHDYNQPRDENFGDWNRLCCDILLTGWYDRRSLGLKAIQMETNDGSNIIELSYAVEIFRSNYLKNAVLSENARWKQKLEQILDKDCEDVRELCKMAGCHPLTIKVMAMQSSCTPWKEERPLELLQRLHGQRIEHAPARAFGITKDGYDHRFGDALTHLEDVFENAVNNDSFSTEEYRCLRNMSLIPYAWGISARRYEEWTGQNADWLSLLRKKGWIEYDGSKTDVLAGENPEGIFRMPMAIARILSRIQDTEPNCKRCANFIEHFLQNRIDDENQYLKREAFASQAETVILQISEDNSEFYASTITSCAYLLHQMGTNNYRRHLEAKTNNKALKIRKQLLGENHPDTATSYNNLGSSYWELGRREKSLEYQEKALEIREKTLGDNHPDTATSYNNVGRIYEDFGDNKEGLKYLEKALEIRKNVFGENHPETAASYNNVGRNYKNQGDLKKGLEYQKKALDIRGRVLGDNNPFTAISYNSVGLSYEIFGDIENIRKGLNYLKKALEIRKNVLGDDHPGTAESYNNVGRCYWILGDHKNGLRFLERALDIRRRVMGEDHPDTATSYNNVGRCYCSMDLYERSLPFLEKALEIRRRIRGESHVDTAESYINVSQVYAKIDDYMTAFSMVVKAYDIYSKKYGEDDAISLKVKSLVNEYEEILLAQ